LITLWFNHTFSSVYNICQSLREGERRHGFPDRLRILLSHENPQFVARPLADEFFLEPQALEPDAYVDWCLATCRHWGVDLFWPARGARALAARKEEFSALSARLLVCAEPEVLDILNDKAAFYAQLAQSGLNLPRYQEVRGLTELTQAVEALAASGRRVCFKPPKSIYGLGFKILEKSGNLLAAYLGGAPHKTTLEEARAKLGSVPPEEFPRLLVMELLPGPEYSLDCLAQAGRLLRASTRQKPQLPGRPEKLVRHEKALAIAERLTEIFQLSHLFNLQLIDSPEGLKLLEINPRMAGGLYFSCLAGINYPYWALRLALGADEALLPDQVYDLFVNQAYQPFIYE
jgi:biotin carboxylase